MAGDISAFLPIAMRMVGDAIKLDSQNCKKEAYCQYLSCCMYISQILKDDAWNKDLKLVYNKDTAKLFKLIQQCQERALTIVSEGIDPSESQSGSPVLPHSQLSHTLPPPQDNKLSDPSVATRDMGKPHACSSSGSLVNLPSPPSSLGHLTSMKSPSRSSYHQDRRPVGHHLRAAKLSTNNTDRTLTSIRRMSENLFIAKAREEAIRKKVWERQQRLQEEANRRFASAVAASQEEQEQRALYTKILEYEQDMVWPRQLRDKLKQTPEDTVLISDIISKIFNSKDHPLKQFLLQYQYHVYLKLLPLLKDVNFPDGKHLNKATNDSAPLDDKGSTNTCPFTKDTSIEVKMEEQTSELGSTHTSLQDESYKNLKEASQADVEENIVNTEKFDNNFNDNTEEMKNENNFDTDTNPNGDDISKIAKDSSSVAKTENDFCCDKIGESKNENEMCQDDIFSIVRSIIEDVIDTVEKAGLESPTTVEDDKESCINIEKRKKDSILQEQVNESNKEETIAINDTSNESDRNSTSYKENISDQTERSEVADSSSFDLLNKEKKTSFLRIKSFDVESEFESLEDDMFDSGSSDDEKENDENSVPPESSPSIEETNAEIAETADANGEFSSSSHTEASTESTKDSSTNVDQNDDTSQAKAETMTHEEDLELTRKQLNEIFVDMRFFLEKLKGFIILAYEELATPIGHDHCYAAVEFPFFQPLWPLLLGVLRRLNFDKELSLGCVMTQRIRNPPAEMGVIDRLCLSDQESLPGNQYPYQPAVEQLHKVATSYCPLEKLDCLVRVLRCICHCVEDYWENKGKPRHCPETSIGCDDLLPVLCYVIVRSGMAQLVSECSAMEEFIPEGYLMGEEGYCLTTLQTALAYLVAQESPH